MHSRIFTIIPETVDPSDCDYDEVSVYEISKDDGMYCDYVSELPEEVQNYYLDDFENYLKNLGVIFIPDISKPRQFRFTKDAPEKYFEQTYRDFQKIAEQCTLSDFSRGNADFRLLKYSIDDKYDIRVLCYDSIFSLDNFIRNILEFDTQYTFGTVYEYHA